MRNLLFRGLHITKDEFVYGTPFKGQSGYWFIAPEGIPMTVQVRPGTIDQWIGVDGFTGPWNQPKSQQLVHLFENDIVEVDCPAPDGPESFYGRYLIKFIRSGEPRYILQGVDRMKIQAKPYKDHDELFDNLRIVGNKHLHPNLLPKRS